MIGAREAMVELLRRFAQTDLLSFLQYVWWMPTPLRIGRHTRAICDRLTRACRDYLEFGKTTYLVITLPFRHGKSDIMSRAFPPFFLGACAAKQPNVIMSGYGANLIEGFSTKAQEIIRSEAYQRVFPNIKIGKKTSAAEWSVEGSQSTVYATGLGGSITGRGGNLIDVDDYLKNREEAESKALRDKLWESFKDDLMTRMNAGGGIVTVCATRWHADDIIGRIKEEMAKDPDYPRFEFLEFPAHKEGPDGWDTLFPEMYDESWYRTQRTQLGPYSAAALLDCDPRLAGTTLFRREWINYYTGELDWRKMRIHIFVDGAKSKKNGSDYTCIQAWGRNRDGAYYLLDCVHARLNLAEKIAEVFAMVERFGGNRRVEVVWWEQVGPMSDVEALMIEMDKRIYHFTVVELHHNTNKDFRIKRLVVPFANHEMWLPLKLIKTRIVDVGGGRAPEAKVYDAVHELVEDEMMLYTGDQESIPHDDMLDCMADLTDEEVMARFTPPEGTAVESHEFGTRSNGSKRLFAR